MFTPCTHDGGMDAMSQGKAPRTTQELESVGSQA